MISGVKPYLATKSSGVRWLGDVPEHWELLPALAVYRPREVKNIGLAEKTVLSLSYGRIVVKPTEKLRGLVPASFETYQIVDSGNIIVRTTDLQNDQHSLRIGHAKQRGIITSAYMCLETTDKVHNEFGYQYLNAYDLLKIIYGYGSGLRQNLDFKDIKRLPVLVPPPEDQAAIVRFLNLADRRIRRAIRAKQNLIKLLEEQKQAIIHHAVTRGLDPNVRLKPSGVEWLGDVPEHWEVKRLKWVTSLQRGYDLPADRRVPGPFPVVSSGGVIDTHSEPKCAGPGVVMGRYGSTDAVFYIEQDFWPHNTSLFVTHFQGNAPKWCYYLLRSITKADHAGKSAVPGVDRKDLFQIVVTVPPVDEQIQIVESIELASASLDAGIRGTEREISLLREYRTRLIADVVTGKLDVREAAARLPDEPDEPEALDDVSDALTDAEGEIGDVDVEAVGEEATDAEMTSA